MEALETETKPDLMPKADEKAAEIEKLRQEYLQKCCEVGQLSHQLDTLHSQKLQLEKSLDVAKQGAKRAALKHDELRAKADAPVVQ